MRLATHRPADTAPSPRPPGLLGAAPGCWPARGTAECGVCRTMAPLHLSAAVRRVTARIQSAQACLRSHSVRSIGGAGLPSSADSSSPDGELIAGSLPNGALIAFYRDIEEADRLEPVVLSNARRTHAQVGRSSAATIFSSRPPTAALRRAVQACLPGA